MNIFLRIKIFFTCLLPRHYNHYNIFFNLEAAAKDGALADKNPLWLYYMNNKMYDSIYCIVQNAEYISCLKIWRLYHVTYQNFKYDMYFIYAIAYIKRLYFKQNLIRSSRGFFVRRMKQFITLWVFEKMSRHTEKWNLLRFK